MVKLHGVPERKFLASGVAGVLAYFLMLLASRVLGIDLTFDVAVPIAAGLMLLVHYYVPPSLQDLMRRIDGEMKRRFALEELGDPQSTLDPEAASRLREGAANVVRTVALLLLLGGLALGGPVACASYTAYQADQATAGQKVYALQLDYNAAALVAVAYLESGHATPAAKREVARLDRIAFSAVTAAADAVRDGDDAAIAASAAAAKAALAELVGYVEAKQRTGAGGPPSPPAAAGQGAGT